MFLGENWVKDFYGNCEKEVKFYELFSIGNDEALEKLSKDSLEKAIEKAELLSSDFDNAKEELVSEIREEVMDNIMISLEERNELTKQKLFEEVSDILSEQLENMLKNLVEVDRTKLYFDYDNVNISKIFVKETQYKENWLSSILIGATSIASGLVLKKVGEKIGGRFFEIGGLLAGGFIGSAAGSGLAEEMFSPEKQTSETSKLDISGICKQLEETIEDNIIKIIDNSKEKIIEKAIEIKTKIKGRLNRDENIE